METHEDRERDRFRDRAEGKSMLKPQRVRGAMSAQESREQHALGEAARAMGQWPRNA